MLRRNAIEIAQSAWRAVRNEVGADELYLWGGLALVATGFWDVWRPASFIAPGMALIWIAMPQRAPFVHRAPAAPDSKKG